MRLPFGRVISPNIIMTTVDESVEESGNKKKKREKIFTLVGERFTPTLR